MGDFENESSNENMIMMKSNNFSIQDISPPEAMYRLLKFPIYSLSHVIYRLAVHLENEQSFILKKLKINFFK